MMTDLKHILFHIARLPAVDQRWILRQLSNTERNTFNHYHGLKHLQEAQRFRLLKTCDLSMAPSEPLPAYCQTLTLKPSLYIAIIIEQGNYPWASAFLEQYDKDGTIQSLLNHQVVMIKPTVKHAVFCEWEQTHGFEQLLDGMHG